MKIIENNPYLKTGNHIQKIQSIQDVNRVRKAEGKDGQKLDTFNLSPEAKEIRVAEEAIKLMPEIREEKVAHFKKLIKNDEYKIDEKGLAEKIITESLLNDLFI